MDQQLWHPLIACLKGKKKLDFASPLPNPLNHFQVIHIHFEVCKTLP